MRITEEALLKNGFKLKEIKNPNDESDPTKLVLFERNGIAVGVNGVTWDVYNMVFGEPLITGCISTLEELLEGLQNKGLVIDWKKYEKECKKSK